MAELPLETWSQALSHLSVRDLLHCALVCHNFAILARPYIVRSIRYARTAFQTENLDSLTEMLASYPLLRNHIRDIQITTTSIEQMCSLLHRLCTAANPRTVHFLALCVLVDVTYPTELQTTSCLKHHSTTAPLHLSAFDFRGSATLCKLIGSILGSIKHLEHLKLQATSTEPLRIPAVHIKSLVGLKSVHFDNVDGLTVVEILAISAASIISVEIFDCPSLPHAQHFLPSLRHINAAEEVEMLVASTLALHRVAIYEFHDPLHLFTAYATSCKHIQYLHLADNPYAEFQIPLREILEALQTNLLPNVTHLECGTWKSLLYLLPSLPASIKQIYFYELDPCQLPRIILTIVQENARRESWMLACYIRLEVENSSTFTIRQDLDQIQVPSQIGFEVILDNQTLWKSSASPCQFNRGDCTSTKQTLAICAEDYAGELENA